MTQTTRVFFSLWPPPEVVRGLVALQRTLAAKCGGRAIAPGNLHITLAFLGAVSEPQLATLIKIAQSLPPPDCVLSVDKLALWKRGGILWAGCNTPPVALHDFVAELAARLRAADFTLDARDFVPHITLFREAHIHPHTPLPAIENPITWPVSGWQLTASRVGPHGSAYQPVWCAPQALS